MIGKGIHKFYIFLCIVIIVFYKYKNLSINHYIEFCGAPKDYYLCTIQIFILPIYLGETPLTGIYNTHGCFNFIINSVTQLGFRN